MAITKREIIEALPLLTLAERVEVMKWLEVYGCRDTSRLANPFADSAFREIVSCITKLYRIPFSTSLHDFSRHFPDQFKRLLRASDLVAKKVEGLVPGRTLTERMAMVGFIARLAFDVTAHRSRMVTVGAVAEAMLNLEATLNFAYPGWLESGDFAKKILLKILENGQ